MTSGRHRRRDSTRNAAAAVLLAAIAWSSCWPGPVHGHRTGSPPQVCRSMTPGHGHAAQSSPAPYRLAVAPDGGAASSVFRVELAAAPEPHGGVDDQYFTGFLVEARVPGTGRRDAVGSFREWTPDEQPLGTAADFKTLNCDGAPKSGVTHNSITKKNSMKFYWEAPRDFNGQVYFVATVALDFSTFWVNITSDLVRVSQSTNPYNNPENVDPYVKHPFSYKECGQSKNCMGSPSGCVEDMNCLAIVTVQPCVENKCKIEMWAYGSKYVAFGLSDDEKMGSDGVVECVYRKSDMGNTVDVHKSLNQPRMKRNNRIEGLKGVALKKFLSTDGFIFCQLSIEPRFEIGKYQYDLENNEYFVLLAAGTDVQQSNIGFHDVAYISSYKKIKIDKLIAAPEVDRSAVVDPFYEGCGVTKTCFGATDECLSRQDCSTVMAVQPEDSNYVFEMKVINASYVAVGLSNDQKMGGDSVMECVYKSDEENEINAYMSWNVPGKKSNKRLANQDGLSLTDSFYKDGTIYCRVVRDAVTLVERVNFDLNKNKYFLLLAAGSSLKAEGVGYHDKVFISTAEAINLSEIRTLKASSKFLVKMHGSLMILAWIGAASVGIVIARYYRKTWVEVKFCSKDFWFGWHRLLMMFTWSFTLAGSACILLEVGGWVSGDKSKNHAIFGVVTTVLVFFQPIFAALRPSPDSTKRPIFNRMHWLVGNAAHVLSIFTIFLATGLGKAELPSWTIWIVVAYMVFYVGVHLILSVYGGWSAGSPGTQSAFPMNNVFRNERTAYNYEQNDDTPNSAFRKIWLYIHVLCISLITLFLVYMVIFAPI